MWAEMSSKWIGGFCDHWLMWRSRMFFILTVYGILIPQASFMITSLRKVMDVYMYYIKPPPIKQAGIMNHFGGGFAGVIRGVCGARSVP